MSLAAMTDSFLVAMFASPSAVEDTCYGATLTVAEVSSHCLDLDGRGSSALSCLTKVRADNKDKSEKRAGEGSTACTSKTRCPRPSKTNATAWTRNNSELPGCLQSEGPQTCQTDSNCGCLQSYQTHTQKERESRIWRWGRMYVIKAART